LESGNNKTRIISCIPRHCWDDNLSSCVKMDVIRKRAPVSTEDNSADNWKHVMSQRIQHI
jgi:hypothetical protein